MLKKTKVKACKLGQGESELSIAEAEVLHLLTAEFLTPKRIAVRRKTTTQAVYLIIQQLKKKGLISKNFKRLAKGGTYLQVPHQIRLHGEQISIQILYKCSSYKDKIGLFQDIDDNEVRCYRDSVQVYSRKSFFGDTVQAAANKSMHYWTRFIARLEHDLGLVLLKPRAQNIVFVNAHYAETSNEWAQEHEQKGLKLRVYTTDDHKLWCEIDNSFNLHELETRHPRTAKDDAEAVLRLLNDLRDHPGTPTLSELAKVIYDLALQTKETAAGLNAVVALLRPGPVPPEAPEAPEAPEYKNGRAEYIG